MSTRPYCPSTDNAATTPPIYVCQTLLPQRCLNPNQICLPDPTAPALTAMPQHQLYMSARPYCSSAASTLGETSGDTPQRGNTHSLNTFFSLLVV